MPADRVTKVVRVYRGDYKLLTDTARDKSAANQRRVTVPDVIHELCTQLRTQEQERGNGMVQ